MSVFSSSTNSSNYSTAYSGGDDVLNQENLVRSGDFNSTHYSSNQVGGKRHHRHLRRSRRLSIYKRFNKHNSRKLKPYTPCHQTPEPIRRKNKSRTQRRLRRSSSGRFSSSSASSPYDFFRFFR